MSMDCMTIPNINDYLYKHRTVETYFKRCLTRFIKLGLFVGSIWMLGSYGFCLFWLLFPLLGYTLHSVNSESRQRDTWRSQLIAMNMKAIIKQLIEDDDELIIKRLPSWVKLPDVESAEWINHVLNQLWPYIGRSVENVVLTQVEDTINASMPYYLPFKFTSVDLGKISPGIGGVKVYPPLQNGEMYMDLEVKYDGDAHFSVSMASLNVGIRNITINGTVRIMIRPLCNRFPSIVEEVVLCFLEPPDITFDLTSLADFPGLADQLHAIVQDQLAQLIVFPNHFPLQIAPSLCQLRRAQPACVVRVTVVEAKELHRSRTDNFAGLTYVAVKLGSQSVKTNLVDDVINPKWDKTIDLVVQPDDVSLSVWIEARGYDIAGKELSLGQTSIKLSALSEAPNDKARRLPLSGSKSGVVCAHLRWLWLAPDLNELKSSKDQAGNNMILIVFLESAYLKTAYWSLSTSTSLKVTIMVGEDKQESEAIENTKYPRWEQGFYFILGSPYNTQIVHIILIETKTERTIGEVNVNLSELISSDNMVMNKKFPLNDVGSFVLARLCLRVLTSQYKRKWFETDTEQDDCLSQVAGSAVD